MTFADIVSLIKKHPAGFAGILVFVVCGAGIYLRFGNLAAGQAELDGKLAEVAKMTANIRNSADLPEQLAEMQALTKDMEGRLLKSSQLAVNLQYFYKLEAENNVKLVDVRQNALPRNAKNSGYIGVPFSVSVQGSFAQVMNFLGRLENGRQLCRINASNFTKVQSSNPGDPLVNLTLNLELLGQP